MPGRTAPGSGWTRGKPSRLAYFEGGPPGVQLLCLRRAEIPPAQSTSRGGGSPTRANAVAPAAGWHIRRSQIAASLAPRLVAARPGRRPRPRYAARGKQTGLRDRSAVLTRQVQSEDTPPPADGFARLSVRSRQMRSLDRTECDRP